MSYDNALERLRELKQGQGVAPAKPAKASSAGFVGAHGRPSSDFHPEDDSPECSDTPTDKRDKSPDTKPTKATKETSGGSVGAHGAASENHDPEVEREAPAPPQLDREGLPVGACPGCAGVYFWTDRNTWQCMRCVPPGHHPAVTCTIPAGGLRLLEVDDGDA